MKLYCNTRNAARAVAKGNESRKVVDAKTNPSPNGSRWAVELRAS
jgi:hypothetical protein